MPCRMCEKRTPAGLFFALYEFFIVHIAMCRVLLYGEDTEIHIAGEIDMKKLAWLSVEDYGTTPMEIVVASAMKGYLRRLPENEALKKMEEIIVPKIIQLFGEGGAPMPVQSHVDGAKFAAFIDEAVADSIRELEERKDDLSGASIAILQNVVGESIVETMSPEFVGFLGDAYRSLKYAR